MLKFVEEDEEANKMGSQWEAEGQEGAAAGVSRPARQPDAGSNTWPVCCKAPRNCSVTKQIIREHDHEEMRLHPKEGGAMDGSVKARVASGRISVAALQRTDKERQNQRPGTPQENFRF